MLNPKVLKSKANNMPLKKLRSLNFNPNIAKLDTIRVVANKHLYKLAVVTMLSIGANVNPSPNVKA